MRGGVRRRGRFHSVADAHPGDIARPLALTQPQGLLLPAQPCQHRQSNRNHRGLRRPAFDDHRAEDHRPAAELFARVAHPYRWMPANVAGRHRVRAESGRRRRSGNGGHQDDPPSAIRGYLFPTARSVLGGFWSPRLGLSEAELHEDPPLALPTSPPSEESADPVQQILAQLSDNYRHVLELRFLHGYSLKEVAAEMNSTVGAIKVMQLRALRAAAKVRPLE